MGVPVLFLHAREDYWPEERTGCIGLDTALGESTGSYELAFLYHGLPSRGWRLKVEHQCPCPKMHPQHPVEHIPSCCSEFLPLLKLRSLLPPIPYVNYGGRDLVFLLLILYYGALSEGLGRVESSQPCTGAQCVLKLWPEGLSWCPARACVHSYPWRCPTSWVSSGH